jgi:hypothetical protein
MQGIITRKDAVLQKMSRAAMHGGILVARAEIIMYIMMYIMEGC